VHLATDLRTQEQNTVKTPPTPEYDADWLWAGNPVLGSLLGLSPVLAVSTSLVNGIGLSVATAVVTILSFATVALLPRPASFAWRLLTFVLILGVYVSSIALVMELYFYPLSRSLGIYLPLICANSALLYRLEVQASQASLQAALLDALKTAGGFLWIIMALAALRELLTTGTILDQLELLKPFPGNTADSPISTELTGRKFRCPLLQPGSLILFGLLVACLNVVGGFFGSAQPGEQRQAIKHKRI